MIVFSYFTGTEIPLGLWIMGAVLGIISLFLGTQMLRFCVKITESGLILTEFKPGNVLWPAPSVIVPWDSIKNMDVEIRGVKDAPAIGPGHIAMLQITCVGQDKPLYINASLYQSGDGLDVLGKYVFERVPHERISDHARRVLRHKAV